MVSAVVLINVQRGKVNETAQSLLEIEGVAEVYSVTGEYEAAVAAAAMPCRAEAAEAACDPSAVADARSAGSAAA